MKPDILSNLGDDPPAVQLARLKRRCRLWRWVEMVVWVGIAAYLLVKSNVL